eukprot:SRR837773.9874.p2 GENE.SRR837773.9874~~SRR837773.9874.p2  ORF type:complete len:171 (-),score=14.53 SRR837773.9874:426-938(-)
MGISPEVEGFLDEAASALAGLRAALESDGGAGHSGSRQLGEDAQSKCDEAIERANRLEGEVAAKQDEIQELQRRVHQLEATLERREDEIGRLQEELGKLDLQQELSKQGSVVARRPESPTERRRIADRQSFEEPVATRGPQGADAKSKPKPRCLQQPRAEPPSEPQSQGR